MTKLQTYSVKGKKTGTIDMPKALMVKDNAFLLTQAVHVYEDRSHQGTSRVKTRTEVHGTTAKMYRQKGTGNARHGDRKAPIFKGGGVAHGPKGIKRELNLSQKLKNNALKVALSMKATKGNMVAVDKLSSIIKTKDAQILVNEIRKDLGMVKIENVRVVLDSGKKDLVKFFRNIKNMGVSYWRNLNVSDIYQSGLVILDRDALRETKKDEKQDTSKSKEIISAEAKISNSKPTRNLSVKKTPVKNNKTKADVKTKAKTNAKKGNQK